MSGSIKDYGAAQTSGSGKSGYEDETERQLGEVDPVAEAKLVRKLDLFIVPVVMLLYLLSFLDRYVDHTSFSTAVPSAVLRPTLRPASKSPGGIRHTWCLQTLEAPTLCVPISTMNRASVPGPCR